MAAVMDTFDDTRYWEYYDGQEVGNFKFVVYVNLTGKVITQPIEGDLHRQVMEIHRQCGDDVDIKLYEG